MSIGIPISQIIGPYRNAYRAAGESLISHLTNLEETSIILILEQENNFKVNTVRQYGFESDYVETISVEFESEQAYAMFLLKWSYA